jgi:hypothetical protein
VTGLLTLEIKVYFTGLILAYETRGVEQCILMAASV